MRQTMLQFLTEKEEGVIAQLIDIGISRRHSLVLVFLATTKEARSRDIERGTGLRQPEVSLAIKYLMERGWVTSRKETSDVKGHPVRISRLAIPFEKILIAIENEEREKAKNILALIKKMREFG